MTEQNTGLLRGPLLATADSAIACLDFFDHHLHSTISSPLENDASVRCDDPDLEHVLAAQNGDLDAFDELVRRHQSAVTAMLFRFCPSRMELEDLVQDTFIRAFKGLERWHPKRPFLHWLKRIALNVGREYCRNTRRTALGQRMPEPIEESSRELAANDDAQRRATALDEAQWLLSHLDGDDRALLTLLYLHDSSVAETAEYFGWSQSKVKVRAYRARKKLNSILQTYDY